MKLTEELEQLKYQLGILENVDCSYEENKKYRELLSQGLPLPDGVLRENPDESDKYAEFYTVKETNMS